MWTVIKYQTKHAGGPGGWFYKWLWLDDETEATYKEAVRQFAETIHQSYDYSDKYRGIDIDRVADKDIPADWLQGQVKQQQARIESAQEVIQRCQTLLDARES